MATDVWRALWAAFKATYLWVGPGWIIPVVGVVVAARWPGRPLLLESVTFALVLMVGTFLVFIAKVASIVLERRPFELDPHRLILLYRGRRNVAFGADTINDTFEALLRVDLGHLKVAGRAAGEQFAAAFNDYVSSQLAKLGRDVDVDMVISWWQRYDDNAGFGRMNPVLSQHNEGVEGRIEFFELFTTYNQPARVSPLCAWMEGYLEGFLNGATLLGGGGNEMTVVKHAQCGGERPKDIRYPCVFEVRRVRRAGVVPESEN